MGLDISTGVYKARKRCGYTQAEMGKAIGVKASTISSYETGKTQPSMDKIMKISEVSGLSIGEILTYTDYHNVDSPNGNVIELFRNLNENDIRAMSSKKPKLSCLKFYEELLKNKEYSDSVIKDFN